MVKDDMVMLTAHILSRVSKAQSLSALAPHRRERNALHQLRLTSKPMSAMASQRH
jgi:hypothetical protein